LEILFCRKDIIVFDRFKLASLTLIAVGGAYFAPAALADSWNKETVVTFNQAVEVPGRLLQPGSYIFKLLDSDTARTIVDIYTADEKVFVTRVMGIRAYQLDTPDKPIFTFTERAAGGPEAVHRWFYPGDNCGIEFVYAKSARQFEAAAQQAPAPAPAPAAIPEAPQVETAGRAMEPEPPVIVAAQEETITVPTPESPAPVAESDTTAETLPQTSSNLAVLPLAGVALLFGGFAAVRFAAARG
jgi:hypothetical protein